MISSNIFFEFQLDRAELTNSEEKLETYCQFVHGAQCVKSKPKLGKAFIYINLIYLGIKPSWNESFKFEAVISEKTMRLSVIKDGKLQENAEIRLRFQRYGNILQQGK